MPETREHDPNTQVVRSVPNWAAWTTIISLLVLGAGWIWQAALGAAALQANTKALDNLSSAVSQLRDQVSTGQREIAVHSSEIGYLRTQISSLEGRISAIERQPMQTRDRR